MSANHSYWLSGIGTDIIEIERIEKAAAKAGDRFLMRIFTPYELDLCMRRSNPWPSLAARFAAKEAVFKALGTGVTNWHEVEITGGGDQPVKPVLSGAAQKAAQSCGANGFMLSISHNKTQAIAFAVALRREV